MIRPRDLAPRAWSADPGATGYMNGAHLAQILDLFVEDDRLNVYLQQRILAEAATL
jgi:hypothetical protein